MLTLGLREEEHKAVRSSDSQLGEKHTDDIHHKQTNPTINQTVHHKWKGLQMTIFSYTFSVFKLIFFSHEMGHVLTS